jgi:alpha-N-arabinofuranosidase
MITSPVAAVEISAARPRITYSRHIFGHFIEHFHRQVYGGIFEPGSLLADERGFRLDVLEALRELKAPNVRWPGGCFVSAYDWLDGVGPARKPTYDPAWRVTDPNTFGTDEFLAWCEELGADPYLCTNAGTGTPKEMAAWLEYTNRPAGSRWADLRVEHGHAEPYAVPFWSIGNENYGDWEIGAKSGREWADFVAESAKLMRRIDPDVALFAAAIEDRDWVLPLLDRAGQFLTSVSIHGYWDPIHYVNEPASYLGAMSKTLEPERQIALVRAMIEVSGQRHITIAFDEWNLRGWHHPLGNTPEAIAARDLNDDNSTYTMADAVFSSTFLNSCLRNADKVTMANLAPTVNTRGPLFVHPDGIVKRTTFHVMQMYATLLAAQVLDTSVQSAMLDTGTGAVPLIDAIATADDDGTTVIVLVNKSDRDAAAVRVRIDGAPLDGMIDVTQLVGEHPDAYNDIDRPDAVTPTVTSLAFADGVAALPAHSITFCTVRLDAVARAQQSWDRPE